jgi:Rad9
MDVVLPSHSVKLFSSAIACFSRIAGGSSSTPGGTSCGQDLYWEFDPITGLEIRTINDAKTAYACMTYQPSFFTHCSIPDTMDVSKDDTQSSNEDRSSSQQSTEVKRTLTCRIALKALVPIVRNRKNVDTLRIRSCSLTQPNDSLGIEFCFTFRNSDDGNNESSSSSSYIRRNQTTSHIQYSENQRMAIHRVHVVDTTVAGVLVVNPLRDASIPPSELVVPPMVLLRLFEPLQRTVEVALIVRGGTNHNNNIDIIDDELTTATNISHRNSHGGSVSASSFHHSDTVNEATSDSATTNNNAILQATTASLLKTETACTSDEFVEFDFISNRRRLDSNIAHNNKVDSTSAMPEDVNQEVILVFSIKEAKAMLQFCCALSQQHQNQALDLFVRVSFHWGGKPLVMQSQSNTYSIQLILATLDYQLLTSMRTTSTTNSN